MPTYSYKERFVPFIKNKTKRQTVRAYRKDGKLPAVGEFVNNFFGMRTKWCTRLNEKNSDKVIATSTIFIFPDGKLFLTPLLEPFIANEYLQGGSKKLIEANYREVEIEDKEVFAWQDGFRPEGSTWEKPEGSFDLMLHFWKQTHELPFTGTVTHW